MKTNPARNLADLSEEELWTFLAACRWPEGFQCPKCQWRHDSYWASGKTIRAARSRGAVKSRNRKPGSFHSTWKTQQNRIVCQKCGHQASLTAGTRLRGARLPLSAIRDAVVAFVGAEKGISAENLGAKLSIASLSARRLLSTFRAVLPPGSDDGLSGVVAVDEAVWESRRRGKPKKDKAWIIIAAEKRLAPHGRIGLRMNPNAFDGEMADKVLKMVKRKSTIETRRPDVYEKRLGTQFFFRHVKTAGDEIGKNLLPACENVAAHVLDVLQNTYRCAFSQGRLQSYLDEIAFRWNHRQDPNEAAWALLARLVPRYEPPDESVP